VVPLCNVILAYDHTSSTFTSVHLLLVQCALDSGSYVDALPIIDQPIIYFQQDPRLPKQKFFNFQHLSNAQVKKLTYSDVLEYFLGVGTIYIALQQWEKALDALENAVTFPMKDTVLSKVMVEAYKKWILVKLLVEGKAGGLPNTVTQAATKAYHTLAKPYETVASIFESSTADRLKQEVDMGIDIWNEDGNTGLMYLVLASFQKFRIRALAKIYRSISISDVTRMTESAEPNARAPSDDVTRALIGSMIDDGTLHASISSSTPTVLIFNPCDPVLPETEVQIEVAASMERLQAMAGIIKVTGHRLAEVRTYHYWWLLMNIVLKRTHVTCPEEFNTDPENLQDKAYLKWAKEQKKRTKNGENGVVAEDVMWTETVDEDEDLMGTEF
jgi:COP9 signalosome complex subunit 3